jgi:hypothetical protein
MKIQSEIPVAARIVRFMDSALLQNVRSCVQEMFENRNNGQKNPEKSFIGNMGEFKASCKRLRQIRLVPGGSNICRGHQVRNTARSRLFETRIQLRFQRNQVDVKQFEFAPLPRGGTDLMRPPRG